MSELLNSPSRAEVVGWQLEVEPGEARKVMEDALEEASARGADVLVADGEMVFGLDHIASAAFHARRAMDEGRNSSKSYSMETLLYASGERQLSSAIAKMSVSDKTSSVAIVLLSEAGLDGHEGWDVLSTFTTAPRTERLIRFGITKEELKTVPPEKRVDLVLEKVAAVDLIKR
ncbi:MAG: hypothetical protein JSV94_02020 [Methanobacteriota archaeon]|nr:MAG: hypothetical protein JSV94_02020 [Euryarchaeota archaeon]